MGVSYPEFYCPDVSRGYSLRPGVEGWYRKEGESYVRINSDGLRDREHSQSKPSDTLRIAVIGDSFAEALQVPMEAAFWRIMESRLGSCGFASGKKIEVINFGVSGYGTGQELLTLREQVWSYSPDLVLLAVTTNNDITDNLRSLKKTDRVPYFVYRDNRLVIDDSFKASQSFRFSQTALAVAGRWLRDRSRLVQVVMEAPRSIRILISSLRPVPPPPVRPPRVPTPAVPTGDKGMKPDQGLLARANELGIDNFVYFEPPNQEWSDAWKVTEGLIVMMRDEVRSRGVAFKMVTLSNGPQVLPDPKSTAEFMGQFGITDLFYPDKRIRALADREGISVITLAPEMQSYAERNKVFLHGFGGNMGFGHWNVEGHKVAGELLAEKLCQQGF
jgi:hypothetical protein